jgi:flagellar biosynthesis protein FliR
MGVFRSFYEAIAPNRARGKTILFVVDVLLLASIMVATPLIRNSAYGSISLGVDLLGGFLIGFTVLISFNAIVYVGSLFSPTVEEST